MKIGVLVKNVPDTETKIKLTGDGKSIETQGIKWVINPFDEFAIEEALKIREKLQDGTTVTVLSLGPDRVVESLRTALAMGADDAVHVKDDAFEGGDSLATAKVLGKVVGTMGFDLVLGGKQGIDFDASQTLAAVAEHLGMAQALVVVALDLGDGKTLTARRRIEGGDEVVEVTLPAVIGCEKGLNEPRYASLPGIMKAKKKPLEEKTLGDLGLDASEFGQGARKLKVLEMTPPPQRQAGKIVEGETPREKAAELARLLHEEAKVI